MTDKNLRNTFSSQNQRSLSNLAEIEAVIFDCDGVLVNSEAKVGVLEAKLMAEYGLTLPGMYPERLKGTDVETRIGIIHGIFPDYRRGDFEQFMKEFRDIHNRENDNISPADVVPGTREVLEFLKMRGVPMAVGSNSRSENLKDKLNRADLSQYFGQHIYSFEDTPSRKAKPEPDLYVYCAQKLGFEPYACIVVDDSKAGIEAAKHAGVLPIGFGEQSLKYSGARIVVPNMPSLLQLLHVSKGLSFNPKGLAMEP